MPHHLLDPKDSVDRQRDKLLTICGALMRRVEQNLSDQSAGYAHFQRAVMLEEQVRGRTRDLERTLDMLNQANAQFAEATRVAEQARADLANAIEAVQEGFALFDAEDRLVMCNSRFGQQLADIQPMLQPGLSFEAYVDLVGKSRHLVLPEEMPMTDWRAQRVARHREDYIVFNVRLIWDRWLQVSEQRTADGGTVMIHTDITDVIRLERHERERMLDDQARIIRATLDHINQGVAVFDPEGMLVGWNQRLSSMLAVPAGRLFLGARFERLLETIEDRLEFAGSSSSASLKAWVARSGARPALSFEVQRGPSMILDVFAEETPDHGFVISFTDVTSEREAIRAIIDANETLEARVAERTLELQHALADAEKANASKSRFVAAASHDLLQPLSAAKLFLSSLEEGDTPPEQQQETLKRARGALGSVETILAALLDISRLDSGLAAMSPAPVPLGLVLATLADEFEPLARAKGLRLVIRPCDAVVKSDPLYLRRILQNLIANAVRYTDSGGVLVGVRRRGDRVRVEVRDTGPGIPEEERVAIFREFHRGGQATGHGDGLGLGLAIVERACALLGHELGLRSHPGRGSLFSVSLGLDRSARPAIARRAPPDVQPSDRLEGLIALVVEPDDELRTALARQLEAWGMEALDLAATEEAELLLEEIGILPDLLILGLRHSEGADALDRIATTAPQLAALPTLVISADKSLSLRENMERRGLVLAHKPLDLEALRRHVATLTAPAISLTG